MADPTKKEQQNRRFWTELARKWHEHLRLIRRNGDGCPHCGSSQITIHAKYRNGRVRYRCRNPHCEVQTFNELTGTALHRSKHPEKWQEFIEYTLQGLSIRTIAAMIEVSPTTIARWRKVLLQLTADMVADSKLEGVVQAVPLNVPPAHSRAQANTLILAHDRLGRVALLCTGSTDREPGAIRSLLRPCLSDLRPIQLRLESSEYADLWQKGFASRLSQYRGVSGDRLQEYACLHQLHLWVQNKISNQNMRHLFYIRGLLMNDFSAARSYLMHSTG